MLNAKGITLKINVTFFVHFCLGEYSFSIDIFNTPCIYNKFDKIFCLIFLSGISFLYRTGQNANMNNFIVGILWTYYP